MTNDALLRETRDRVLHLSLNRPDKRNALSSVLRSELVECLRAASDDDEVGAVLLTGVGSAFCAGFDLSELTAVADPAVVFADAEHYHAAVHGFAKPIVAAVNGPALAGGFDLALMCDVRIASESAAFGQPQVRHGIPAAYELMAYTIGVSVARDLCLTGRIVDAHEALRIGIVSQVAPPGELSDVAASAARTIAEQPDIGRTKQRFIAGQPTLFGPRG